MVEHENKQTEITTLFIYRYIQPTNLGGIINIPLRTIYFLSFYLRKLLYLSYKLKKNLLFTSSYCDEQKCFVFTIPEVEFKEFERRFKFKPQLKYGCLHLNLYYFFQDLSQRSIKTGFWRI